MRRILHWFSLAAAAAWLGLAGPALAQQAQVTADKSSYGAFEEINVTWSGLQRGTTGWIALVRPGSDGYGSSDQMQSLMNFHGEFSSGRYKFRGAMPGNYEVILFAAPRGTESRRPVLARISIVVTDRPAAPGGAEKGPQVGTSKPSFQPLEPIEVRWSNVPLRHGWIGIGRRGESVFRRNEPTHSLPPDWEMKPQSGTHTFAGLLPGEYEVRIIYGELHAPGVLARQNFTIKD